MTQYNNLKQSLETIRNDVLSSSNPYSLSSGEKNAVRIVLNTLKAIIDRLDELHKKSHVYFFYGNNGTDYAPIHLENYPLNKKEREQLLIGSLVELFITCFNKVKNAGPGKVRIFCSHLHGGCIDGLTRQAFDYALNLDEVSAFTETIEQCIKLSPFTIAQRGSYFWTFAELLNKKWDEAFKADKNNGFCKRSGVFNAAAFPLIRKFMQEVLQYAPSNDFLFAFKHVKVDRLKFFLNFVFSDQEFIKSLKLTETEQQLFDDFMLKEESFPTLHDLIDLKVDPEIVITLIKNISPYKLFEIWKFIQPQVSNKWFLKITPPLLDTLKNQQPSLEKFITTPIVNGETLLHRAAKLKQLELVERLLQYGANAHALDVYHKYPIQIAYDVKAWDVVLRLFEALKDDNDKIYLSMSLLYVVIENKCDLAEKFLQAGAETNLVYNENAGYSVLHSAVLSNNKNMIDLLLNYNADINHRYDSIKRNGSFPTALMVAAKHSDVTVDTLRHLLHKPYIDVNYQWDKQSALYRAAFKGDVGKVAALLEHPDIDLELKNSCNDIADETALEVAIRKDYVEVVTVMIRKENRRNNNRLECALVFFAKSNRFDMVKKLLKQGISPNPPSDDSALCHAVMHNNQEMIDLLVKHHADVNHSPYRTNSPLKTALTSQISLETFLHLLQMPHLDVNVRFMDGKSLLEYAAEMGNFEKVSALLMHPAININDAPIHRITALNGSDVDKNSEVMIKLHALAERLVNHTIGSIENLEFLKDAPDSLIDRIITDIKSKFSQSHDEVTVKRVEIILRECVAHMQRSSFTFQVSFHPQTLNDTGILLGQLMSVIHQSAESNRSAWKQATQQNVFKQLETHLQSDQLNPESKKKVILWAQQQSIFTENLSSWYGLFCCKSGSKKRKLDEMMGRIDSMNDISHSSPARMVS